METPINKTEIGWRVKSELRKEIKKLNSLIETIEGEIELADEPKEYSERMVLDSIRKLIEQSKNIK